MYFSSPEPPKDTKNALTPGLFWRIIAVVAFFLAASTAAGVSVFGASWLTAYWDALAYRRGGGYCRQAQLGSLDPHTGGFRLMAVA